MPLSQENPRSPVTISNPASTGEDQEPFPTHVRRYQIYSHTSKGGSHVLCRSRHSDGRESSPGYMAHGHSYLYYLCGAEVRVILVSNEIGANLEQPTAIGF